MQTIGLKGARLSQQQELLWSLLREDTSSYSIQGSILLRGPLDRGAFQRAIQDIVDLHEIMHTVFYPLPGMDVPVQVVMKQMPVVCPLINIEDVAGSQQESLLEHYARALKEEPFDLAHGPLLRVVLLRLAEQKHIVVLCLSAFCADAASLRQIIAELARVYSDDPEREQQATREEPLQYIDVAAWQNKLLASEGARKQYWRKRKPVHLAAMRQLFRDKERREPSRLNEGTGAFLPQKMVVPLEPGADRQIRAYVKQAGVSSSAFLFTCWKTLLWRFTNEPDGVIGVACDGRIYEELTGVLGLLTRFVPVPTHSQREQVFSHAMISVHAGLQEAGNEQAYFTWDEVVDDENEPHFFPLAFEYTSVPAHIALTDALEMSVLHLASCTVPFTLKLSVCETGESLQCEIYYDPAEIAAVLAEQLALGLQTIIESALKDPQATLATLRVVSQQLEEHLLRALRAPTSQLSSSVFHHLFEEQVVCVPGQLALISGDEQITYDDLNRRVNQLARVLRRYGVGPGQLVGLCVARSCTMIIGLLAILKAGGAYVPLDPESPSARLIYQLHDVQAALLLTQRTHLPLVTDWDGQKLCLEAAMEEAVLEPDTNLAVLNTPQDLAYVIYTSGSTGVPKGVMIQQCSVVNYTLALRELIGQEAGLHFATVSTLAADLGNTAIFCALASGGCLQVLEYETITSGEKFAQWVVQHPIDVLKIVPSHLAALLAHEEAAKILPRHSLLLGGEALPFSLLKRLQESGAECTLFNHYGPTETTVGILVNKLGKVADVLSNDNGGGNVPLGRPIANGEVYILDEEEQLVPMGVTGEIYVGGAGVAAGYVRQPEQTAARFVPHVFARSAGARLYKTGDLARYTLKGDIEFVGRRDSQIKLHGYRIELSEIEIALRRHANIVDVVVMLHEDAVGQRLLVAYVVPREQPVPEKEELRDFLRTSLPSYMFPASFVYLKALPLTANGKVDRKQLQAPGQKQGHLSLIHAQEKPAKPPVQPRDIIEFRLLQIWEEILQRRPISVVDNFFDLGGYSMVAVRLVSQIFKQFGQEVAPTTLFQYPTIASLAGVLRQQVKLDDSSALVAIQPQGAGTPFFCVHPAGGTVFCYSNLAQHLGSDQPFYGLQFPQRFKDGDGVSSIEELANYYIAAMQSVQPCGPYMVGGWSSGGIVAFEIACQLRQKGQEVALLAIIDSTMPQTHMKMEKKQEASPTDPLDLSDGALAQDVLRHFHITPPAASFSLQEPEEQLSFVLEKIIQADEAPVGTTLEQFRYHARVRKINTFLAHEYQPKSYSGFIHLFMAQDVPVTDSGDAEKRDDPVQGKARQIQGWTDVTEKGVSLSSIPGTHDELVEEPNVIPLAMALKEAIGSVEKKKSLL